MKQIIGKFAHKMIFILLLLGVFGLIAIFPITKEKLLIGIGYYIIVGSLLVLFYYLDIYRNYFELKE